MSLPAFTTPATLPPGFEQPAGWRWQAATMDDGAILRIGTLPVPAATRNVLVLPGFSEFGEKYFDTAAWLAGLGYQPWTLDWRGQGGSTRPRRNPEALQCPGFDRHTADVFSVIARVIGTDRPLAVIGHSMGGHLTLRFLAEHASIVDRAVLSSPMLGVPTGAVPNPLARAIAMSHVAAGFGSQFVWGFRPWQDLAKRREATTRDETQADVHAAWFRSNPGMRIGGPAWSWLSAALESCAWLQRPATLRSVTTPLLIGSAGDERFVAPAAIPAAASHLPRARHHHFADARHELFLELAPVKTSWRGHVAAFLAG
jgi:lysophospholipase